MRTVAIYFNPTGEYEFTEREIAVLIQCAIAHYDSKCNQAAVQGGFLYGMKNRCEWARDEGKNISNHALARNELDLLVKIVEVGNYVNCGDEATRLGASFRNAMNELSESAPSRIIK